MDVWQRYECGESCDNVTPEASTTLITNVARLHSRLPDRPGAGSTVLLDCILTYYDPNWQMAFVQITLAGFMSHFTDLVKRYLPIFDRATRVRLHGLSGAGDFAPVVQAPTFEFLEHASLPPPSATPDELIFSGQADSQWVELEGIVHGFGFEGNHPFAKLTYGTHDYKVLFPPSVN